MSTAGRKPIPTALKILRGNPGKRPLNADEPKPPLGVGAPSPRLTGEALAEWHRRVVELDAVGILTQIDAPAFEAYCRAWGRYVEAEAEIKKTSPVAKAPSGYPMVNPYLQIANRALDQCRAFWTEFGMMPCARVRLHVRRATPTTGPEKRWAFMRT